ncbi:nuclear transport factor 2 family protein [Sphingosinicella xenopeptidilytica]|uniref:Nuclear transport factor 2 family protein n=1 Tax=Sphingosinicella xenopeptidilytica TaxID=364098 RepID=A0ABW3C4K4_SPHXN
MGNQDSDTHARNVAAVHRWAELYNTDVARMISELYHPDATMGVMGSGEISDPEPFKEFEQAVLRAAPRRYIRIQATYPFENHVVVESLLFDPDKGANWSLPFCTILTFRDGKIATDRNYLDFSQWPAAASIQPETVPA